MKKRFLSLLLALIVFLSSVTVPYYETMAFDIPTAFWGTIEAGRAMFTALEAGGGMSNGISLSKLELSSRNDIQRFQTQILIAYEAFCIYKEKLRIALENPSLSENEVNEMATSSGTKISNDFKNNAINVNTTTGKLSVKDYGYWKDFCNNLSYIAKNGLGQGDFDDNTIIESQVYVEDNFLSITSEPLKNIGSNCFVYNDNYYVSAGKYVNRDFSFMENVPTDRIRIPYIIMYNYVNTNNVYSEIKAIDVNRLSGEVITESYSSLSLIGNVSNYTQYANDMVRTSNFPIGIFNVVISADEKVINWRNNYVENLRIKNVGGNVQTYQAQIKDALDNNLVGESIKEGGVARENIVSDNTIPVKRSSLTTKEETVEGVVGWDIPDTAAIVEGIADPNNREEEAEGMGIITVPENAIEDVDEPGGVIAIPKHTPISIPETEDEPIPTTIDDVISIQSGEFYPSQIDITEFFPFCIPFDIAYCVNKFHVSVGSAPIIHIPIVYPTTLQGTLGESYDVVIDFNEYIVLRNIIRYFILLLFIIGLMQITRNLIRG